MKASDLNSTPQDVQHTSGCGCRTVRACLLLSTCCCCCCCPLTSPHHAKQKPMCLLLLLHVGHPPLQMDDICHWEFLSQAVTSF